MTDEAAGTHERPGLREYARVLRRRWRTAAAVVLACVGVAIAYSLAVTPVYLASADVLIEPSGADIQVSGESRIDADEVATQTQVVTSLPVARLVQAQFSLSSPPDLADLVTVQSVGTSRILRITARDTDPDSTAETANAVAASYLQFREQDSIGRYEQTKERLAQEQADLERRLAEIDRILDDQPRADPALQTERRGLLTTLSQITAQSDALTDSLTAAASGGELLRAAQPPTSPISPKTLLNALLGALVGVVLGIGAALLRDRLDDVVHEEETVRRSLDAVVLGRIPQWSARTHRDRLVTLQDPHSPASEEYQRLGVNVRFMLAAEDRRGGAVVVVTSGQEGEGKTATASNLAVALARLGMRVVLVDADLRRATAAHRFGLGDPPGLSDLLVGDHRTSSYLVDVGVEHLEVLPAGTTAPNPAALLGSARLRHVLGELAADADLLIVDSPPLLTGADTLELANVADMVVVVTRERVSRRRELISVRESLRQASVETVGVVFNAIADSSRSTYSYTPRERTVVPLEEGPVGADDSAPEVSRRPGA